MALSNAEMHSDHYDRSENVSNSMRELLKKFGLTKNELTVYLYLTKHGVRTANEISQGQKIPRTETYPLLSSLKNKGMIKMVYDKPVKFKGLSYVDVLNVLIHDEFKKIDELQSMKDEIQNTNNLKDILSI